MLCCQLCALVSAVQGMEESVQLVAPVGDTATYTCNTGFKLIGQAVTTCTLSTNGNSASFLPAQPICRRKWSWYQ